MFLCQRNRDREVIDRFHNVPYHVKQSVTVLISSHLFFIQETKLVSRYHLSLFDADTYRVAESHPSELPKPEETKEHHCSLKASH